MIFAGEAANLPRYEHEHEHEYDDAEWIPPPTPPRRLEPRADRPDVGRAYTVCARYLFAATWRLCGSSGGVPGPWGISIIARRGSQHHPSPALRPSLGDSESPKAQGPSKSPRSLSSERTCSYLSSRDMTVCMRTYLCDRARRADDCARTGTLGRSLLRGLIRRQRGP